MTTPSQPSIPSMPHAVKRFASPLNPRHRQPVYARLPLAPRNASPVPHLTSLYHFHRAGEYGDRTYPGNCGGNLIKDLLRYFKPWLPCSTHDWSAAPAATCARNWASPAGRGTSTRASMPATPQVSRARCFDFIWIHPPYWRQKLYADDPTRPVPRRRRWKHSCDRYRQLIANCAEALKPGGKLAILMGDYNDRKAGFVPLTYWTQAACLRGRPSAALHRHHPLFATVPAAARRSTAAASSLACTTSVASSRTILTTNLKGHLPMTSTDQLITDIAREHFGIPTLTPRMTDALDFHTVAVWQLKTALTAAFMEGAKAACPVR